MKLWSEKRNFVMQTCFSLHNITFIAKKNLHFEKFFILKQKKQINSRNFEKNKIVEMKSRGLQISDVAKRFGLNLIVSGKAYKILCPFHEEITPSLVLNDEVGTYHCFGCGASGNAFKFFKYLVINTDSIRGLETKISLIENSNFRQKIYQNTKFNGRGKFSKLSSSNCIWLLQIAGGFFIENLRINKLLKVLVFSRGISIGSSRIYGLGYASGEKNVLFNYLNNSGLKMTDIIRSGLVYTQKKKIQSYISMEFKKDAVDNFSDVFRGRMIIPIKNRHGVIIGFGGRIVNKLKLAKYINSSDSNIFKKKKILFSEDIIAGFFQKTFKSLILTEGYMDSIGLFQNGIKFTSASLGTSLGTYQIERLHLLSLNCHIIVYFDADCAGEVASKKILFNNFEKLTKHYFCISMVELSNIKNVKDPDDFVYFQGSSELTKKVFNHSLPVLKWVENRLLNGLLFLFINFLCSIQSEKIDKFFSEEFSMLIKKNFFQSLVLKISVLLRISKKNNYKFKKKNFINSISNKDAQWPVLNKNNDFLFEKKKREHIRACSEFRYIKNLIFLSSLLFPALKDDLIQMSMLNGYFFPDFMDTCLHKTLFSRIFINRKLSTRGFFDVVLEYFSVLLINPNNLKLFLLFTFGKIDYFSSKTKKKLSYINELFYLFFLFFLAFKIKQIDKKLKIISFQTKKFKTVLTEITSIKSKQKLDILNHRKNRGEKLIRKLNLSTNK